MGGQYNAIINHENRLEQNSQAWLAPLKNWLKDAQTSTEIATAPALAPKKNFGPESLRLEPVPAQQKN